MKLSFIHLGFNKTGSTYLQNNLFKKTKNFYYFNNDNNFLWFYKNFVNINPHNYSKDFFLSELNKKIKNDNNKNYSNKGKFFISDENLSGDIYSGLNSRELMLRILDTFGKVKIIIFIRNQIDMILSIYSNYIINGGNMGIIKWIDSDQTRNGSIINKLNYFYLINDYIKYFGRENVIVYQFEDVFKSNASIEEFSNQLGLDVALKNKSSSYAINKGRSLVTNNILRYLNFSGYTFNQVQKFLSYKKNKSIDRNYLIEKMDNSIIVNFKNNNSKLETLLNVKLNKNYFFVF